MLVTQSRKFLHVQELLGALSRRMQKEQAPYQGLTESFATLLLEFNLFFPICQFFRYALKMLASLPSNIMCRQLLLSALQFVPRVKGRIFLYDKGVRKRCPGTTPWQNGVLGSFFSIFLVCKSVCGKSSVRFHLLSSTRVVGPDCRTRSPGRGRRIRTAIGP